MTPTYPDPPLIHFITHLSSFFGCRRRELCLQHTAPRCNTLQHTLPHTATHCNTLIHSTTHCNTLRYCRRRELSFQTGRSCSRSNLFATRLHRRACLQIQAQMVWPRLMCRVYAINMTIGSTCRKRARMRAVCSTFIYI